MQADANGLPVDGVVLIDKDTGLAYNAAGGGGSQYTEDAAAAANPTGNVVNLIRKDTPAALVSADGDNVAQRGTDYGAAYTQIVTSTGSFVDTFGGGTQYTEGDTDASITGTVLMMEGAANAIVAAPGTAADGLLVNLGTNNDVTVTGSIAHDSADSGNPVKTGGVARQTNPTAVADGDRVNASFDDLGRQIVVLNQVRDLTAEAVLTVTSSTTETTLIAAAASTLHDITSLIITNSSATATLVTLRDATGGGTARVYSIAANGGVVIAPLSVPLKQATANNNWTITCGTSVASIYVHAVYVKNI